MKICVLCLVLSVFLGVAACSQPDPDPIQDGKNQPPVTTIINAEKALEEKRKAEELALKAEKEAAEAAEAERLAQEEAERLAKEEAEKKAAEEAARKAEEERKAAEEAARKTAEAKKAAEAAAKAQAEHEQKAYEQSKAQSEANVAPAVKEAIEAGLLCSECGKKGGNGTNGTCGRFTREKDCPNCGVHVQARTCHTCAN